MALYDDLEMMGLDGLDMNGSLSLTDEEIAAYLANMSSTRGDDEEQYKRDLITYYIMGVCGMTVCCFGLIGNILSLLVLTRKTMRSSTYSYLSALSVCDSFVLILTMVLLIKDLDKPVRGQDRWPWDEGVYPYLFPFVHPAAFALQVISVWLTLAFTVDRYIMICHPFTAEPYCTIKRARMVIAALFIIGIIFNLPKFFEYETVSIHLPHKNVTKIGCDLTWFGRSHIFRELYHSWFYITFVCGIPFITLAVLNSCLMHAVRLSRQRGKEINAAEKKRNDTTVMLIGVVVTFFICQMPALVSRTVWAFEQNPTAFKRMRLYTLNEVGNFLIVLNSSINIVPYYFFGRRFRRQFWSLFCHCLLEYKKFRKLSRSFSQTVVDGQRRPSEASNKIAQLAVDATAHTTLAADDSRLELQSLTSDCAGSNKSTSHSNRKLSAASSWSKDSSLHRRSSEVNGNCIQPGEEKQRHSSSSFLLGVGYKAGRNGQVDV